MFNKPLPFCECPALTRSACCTRQEVITLPPYTLRPHSQLQLYTFYFFCQLKKHPGKRFLLFYFYWLYRLLFRFRYLEYMNTSIMTAVDCAQIVCFLAGFEPADFGVGEAVVNLILHYSTALYPCSFVPTILFSAVNSFESIHFFKHISCKFFASLSHG